MNAPVLTTRRTAEFLGLRFDCLDQGATIKVLRLQSEQNRFAYLVTPNVDHVVALSRVKSDYAVRWAYDHADLLLCDSRILQMLARWSGVSLPLVTGSDLTARLLREVDGKGVSIAIVGGDTAILSDLRRLYPAITWQQHVPPMGVRQKPEALQAIAAFVEQAKADYVFFAIGAPQSELVCAEIARRGKAQGFALCIGASLEFVTGAKKRAPKMLQLLHLEWFFRLLSEPRRLWHRYLVEGPKIISIWLRWRANRFRPHGESGSSRPDPS